MDQVARRGGLRTRLLVGVAAVALAAPVSRLAQAQEAAKWSPYIELGGMGGNTHSFGDVDIFIPLWQDQTSLLFGDLRGTFSTEPTQEGNFGLGYRTQLNTDWILGGYGYFDIQNSKNDNLFYQATLGVELLSVDWDFRLNGYIPLNPDGGTVDNSVGIGISGNNIQMQTSTKKEKALYGFDGEVGWRLPVFPVDGDMDIRVFAGGYYFANSDVDTIAGPRGRIEARLYDIDFLGLQSRLTAQGVVQWDQPRGTQGFGGLELRIPLGAVTGNPGPKLNPLDRRMVDRVQRDVDIITEETAAKSHNEDVIVDELTVSTHTIVFANSGGTGTGKKHNPIDLNAAPALAPGLNKGTGSNAIILANGAAGTIAVSNPLQLLSGQALIGGGSKVLLTGAKTGEQVNFRFPGTRPTLSGSTSTANLIQMQPGSQNEVFGLDLTGAFSNGVFGSNMERAIVKQTSIESPAADGILLSNTDPVTNDSVHSQFVHIEGNTVISAGRIGIRVATLLDDGSSFGQTINIDDNTVIHSAREGIYVYSGVKGGSFLSQNVTIDPNTVISNGRAGIKVGLFVSNASANQSVAVTDNIAEGNGSAGIYVGAVAQISGSITQTALVAGNRATSNGRSGIYFSNRGSSGSTISSMVEITDNTAIGNRSNGIYVDTRAEHSSTVRQTLVIRGNTAESNSGNGIYLDTFASAGGTVSQNATIADNLLEHNGRNGLYVDVGERSSGTVIQTLTAYNNTASFNTSSGIRVNVSGNAGGSVSQTAVLTDNLVLNNASQGIYFRVRFSSGATLSQDIVIDPSTISDNLGAGILIHSRLYDASFTQNVSILGNVITSNSGGGIVVDNVVGNRSSGATTTLWQGVTVSGNTIAYNGGRLSVTSAGNVTVNVTGGGVDISLFANNIGTSGTVNLNSAIEISDNLFSSNFVRYAGTSGAISIGLNLNVIQSGSNGAGHGTVNMVGNQLTIENNRFFALQDDTSNGISRGPDILVQAFAINDAGGGPLVSGAINLLNNTTTIRGNSIDSYALLNSMGVNGSSSSGITAGAISFANNVTTVQDNIFNGGGVFVSNLLVNGTDGAGVSGGSVVLANNTMTFEGNTGGSILISNDVVNGTDNSAVSGGNAIMASNHTTIDGNTGNGVFIFNQVVNGSDSAGVTNGGAAMSNNVTTITDNSFYRGGISILNVAVNGTDSAGVTSGTVTMTSNAMTIDGNSVSDGFIFVQNLGVNGSSSSGVTGGGVTLANNLVTITGNQIHYEARSSGTGNSLGIIVIDQVVNGTSNAHVSGGGATLSSNVVTITDNLLQITTNTDTSSNGMAIFVEMVGQNGDSSSLTSSVVTLANNGITVTNNRLLYTGGLGLGGSAIIAVIDSVSAESGTGGGVNLSDHIVISTNTIAGYNLASSGILAIVGAGNDASSGGTAIAVENTSIIGNRIAGPIFMVAEVGNSASNGAASMTNNLTIAGNTASDGIIVLNEAQNDGSNGAVSMGNFFSITDNSADGIGVFNVVGNSGSNGAGGNVSMTNTFSINDNDVSRGVFVFDVAVNGTSSTPVAGTVKMSNTVTIERNTIAGGSFGVLVLDEAFNTGGTVSLSTALDIEQNVVSGASSAGMEFVVYSTSSAVSQGAQLKNNTVTSNGLYIGSSLGGFGIRLLAHQTGAGAAVQNFTLSGNVISDNTSDGINTKASGAGAAQTISLATGSGNHINANGGFGAYLSNNGGTVVFNINGNDLSGNSDGPFSTAGAGITVNP